MLNGDERRISGDRLELMRSAIAAYASSDEEPSSDEFRAAVRDAVVAGSSDLDQLADLFNDLAEAAVLDGP